VLVQQVHSMGKSLGVCDQQHNALIFKAWYFVILHNFKSDTDSKRTMPTTPKSTSRLHPLLIAKSMWPYSGTPSKQIPASEKIKAPLCCLLFYVKCHETHGLKRLGKLSHVPYRSSHRGDAAQTLGGGAYCACLYFWFNIEWPPKFFMVPTSVQAHRAMSTSIALSSL
jgi:hypothetical protein